MHRYYAILQQQTTNIFVQGSYTKKYLHAESFIRNYLLVCVYYIIQHVEFCTPMKYVFHEIKCFILFVEQR